MILRETQKYRYQRSQKPRKFYGCSKWPSCKNAHGAHPDGRPLGHPADKETRALRHDVHELLNQLTPPRSKNGQSNWLKKRGFGGGHCGNMDKQACRQAIVVLRQTIGLKTYAIHQGFVIARDGDEHFISARELAQLYHVPNDDWVEWRHGMSDSGFIHLYPKASGDYTLPPNPFYELS